MTIRAALYADGSWYLVSREEWLLIAAAARKGIETDKRKKTDTDEWLEITALMSRVEELNNEIKRLREALRLALIDAESMISVIDRELEFRPDNKKEGKSPPYHKPYLNINDPYCSDDSNDAG